MDMDRFTDTYRNLNAAQKQAVDTIEGPVLVVAGPGTGKTQLLSARVANILKKTDTGPENIVCLTFTDAAAVNMRERLAGMIGAQAYAVTISTYHAFGSELVRRYGSFFADQPQQTAIDDLGIDSTLRAIITELPYGNPLKYADSYIRDVRSTISDFKRALLTPADVRAIDKANEAFLVFANEQVATHLAAVTRIDKKSIAAFTHLLEATAAFEGIRIGTAHSIAADWQSELFSAVKDAEESGKTTRITQWKNRWLAKDAAARFIVGGVADSRKLSAIAHIYEEYDQRLKQQNLFDYDDMILKAIRGLEDNDELRFTLQEQYLYMLLDEFQDTNDAQLRLVELLTDSPVNEGRPNVLAVGDDDQAIYAFQGANYSHMLQFKEMYRDVAVIPLVENYRSAADILKTAENISGQIGERLQSRLPAIDKTLKAANAAIPAATIERLEYVTDVSQYAGVVEKIKHLIEQGTAPSEIAVLAPQHRYLVPLLPYLREAAIPVYYEKRENVLDNPLITQLITMCRLVLALQRADHAAASGLWPAVISYDFWQLPTRTIWQTSWNAYDEHQDWTNTLLTDSALTNIGLFFIRLSQIAASEPLEIMLDYLVGVTPLPLNDVEITEFQSPFYAYHFADSNPEAVQATFWDLLSNLTILRSQLRNYHSDELRPLLLTDFIEFVAAHQQADIKILNTNPHQEASSAVQLMTAYKSKGLEFSAVFVLACLDEVWGSKARSQSSNIPLPANLQHIRYAGQTHDERLRLFYVALTRAKTHLYLTSYANTIAGKHTTELSFLEEQPVDTDVTISPLLPTESQLIKHVDVTVPSAQDLVKNWQQRHLSEPTIDLQSAMKARLENYQISPTDLNSFIDLQYAGPQSYFMNKVLRFPSAPTPEGQYGNAIHETLEWLNNMAVHTGQIPGIKAIHDYFDRQMRSKRLGEVLTAQLIDRGRLSLEAYLEQRVSVITENNVSEHKFRNEGVFCGEAHLTGKIDKLIVDKAAKTIRIVDYKTGRSYDRWKREPKLHRYKQQLYIYKLLVENSRTYKDYTVVDAYLEFVEPNEAGKIVELHIDFDEAECKRIGRLAEVIWRHIKDLSFPDVSQYGDDMSAIEQFETDLLEGII
ncbi:MAG: uvrD [Candidatus Saccharibacteria bacterium]|nr:uvrD [Candidatus Saccharibacteria bacterium]